MSIKNNTTSLQELLEAVNNLPNAGSGGTQATPVISVNSTNGLITATAGTKFSTHQLAFQPAKTITPSTASQVAVSSGYYTGGNITVAAVPTQTKSVTPKTTSQNVTPDSGKFLSKVTVAGDSNLVAGNIKSGVSIFGVNGAYSPQQLAPILQDKIIIENGIYTADNNFDGLGTVTVDVQNIETEQVEWSENEDAMVTSTLSSYFNDRVTTIRSCAFYACSNLTTTSFPKVADIGNNAFCACPNLTTVSFPVATSIGSNAFYNCKSLTTASFPVATSIRGTYAFGNCYNLKSLYLTGSRLCKLSASNAFTSTPIGGYSASAGTYGSIYVPASLLTSYKTATNWTYFSSRFVGI